MIRRRTRRKGLVLIPALVSLILVGLLSAAVIRLAQTQRRVTADEERKMQAEWLVESGFARAAARLAADPAYAGETWSLSASALGGNAPGVVTIAVEAGAVGTSRRVRVEAEYPSGESPRRNKLSKRTTVDVGTDRPGGAS